MEDVLLLTAGMLAEDERVAAQVRRQYKWFVVDEFQDVSPDPVRAARPLARWPRRDLRGRRPGADRSTPSPAPTPATCATSRRSSPAPPRSSWSATTARPRRSSTAANTPARRLHQPGRRAARPAPGRPRGHLHAAPDEVAEAEARRRRDRRPCATPGRSLGEVAVLFRINAQSEAYEDALSAAGDPLRHPRRGPLLRPARGARGRHPAARRGPLRRGRGRVPSTTVRGTLSGMGWTDRGAHRPGSDPRPLGVLAGAGRPGRASSPHAGRRPRRLRRRPRPPCRRAARAGRRGRHAGDVPRRQGPGVGLGLPLRPAGRHPAHHLRRHPRRRRGGAPPALRRHDPRPRRPGAVLVAGAQPRRPRRHASPRASSTPCCPPSRRRPRPTRRNRKVANCRECGTPAVHRRGEEARPLRRLPGLLRRGALRAAARVAQGACGRGERCRPSWSSPTPPCS